MDGGRKIILISVVSDARRLERTEYLFNNDYLYLPEYDVIINSFAIYELLVEEKLYNGPSDQWSVLITIYS